MRDAPLARLRYWRDKRVMTQRELNEASGVAAATIARLENGKQHPKPITVKRLAKALGVEPGELY